MSGIKRYDHVSYGMVSDRNGEYIFHSDHEAEVARLRAEAERLRNELRIAVAAVSSKAGWEWKARAEADAAALQRVKDIVAMTRHSILNAYERACQNGDGRTQAICNVRTSLLNNIAAAMGEGK